MARDCLGVIVICCVLLVLVRLLSVQHQSNGPIMPSALHYPGWVSRFRAFMLALAPARHHHTHAAS